MTYKLEFIRDAFKEWKALDTSIQNQFKKKLAERLQNPEVPSARLIGSQNRYKIKLRGTGFRLVYEVHQQEVLVLVVAVGKRHASLHRKGGALGVR